MCTERYGFYLHVYGDPAAVIYQAGWRESLQVKFKQESISIDFKKRVVAGCLCLLIGLTCFDIHNPYIHAYSVWPGSRGEKVLSTLSVSWIPLDMCSESKTYCETGKIGKWIAVKIWKWIGCFSLWIYEQSFHRAHDLLSGSTSWATEAWTSVRCVRRSAKDQVCLHCISLLVPSRNSCLCTLTWRKIAVILRIMFFFARVTGAVECLRVSQSSPFRRRGALLLCAHLRALAFLLFELVWYDACMTTHGQQNWCTTRAYQKCMVTCI